MIIKFTQKIDIVIKPDITIKRMVKSRRSNNNITDNNESQSETTYETFIEYGEWGIRMKNDEKYPVSYEKFVNDILKAFVEVDWKYDIHFTKEQKQEFIDKHNFDYTASYQEECDNYDNGRLNVFDTPDDTVKYIFGLLFDCERYYNPIDTESEKDDIDESKYPMTYKEFEKKIGKEFIKRAPKRYNDVTKEDAEKDWKAYLDEYGDVRYIYRNLCEQYDNGPDKEYAFTDVRISYEAGDIVEWVYF